MKTNHRRNFKANKPRDQAMWCDGVTLPAGLGTAGASIGNDASHHNGLAHGKRGGKKHIRVCLRRTERKHIEDQLLQ